MILVSARPSSANWAQFGGTAHLVSYTNMRGNCRKNISRSGSTPPTNPAALLPPFANLLSKGHIKCGVTGSVTGLGLGLVLKWHHSINS